MRMRLTYGVTATADAENASVIETHFAKIFCADLPIDWSALQEVGNIYMSCKKLINPFHGKN